MGVKINPRSPLAEGSVRMKKILSQFKSNFRIPKTPKNGKCMLSSERILQPTGDFSVNIFLICGLILLGACNHKSESTQQVGELSVEVSKSKFYCEGLTDDHIEKRCDRGTFANMANAFCETAPYDNSRHEWNPGEHHRDVKPNVCYPEDSKSECSPDYFITKFHEWLTTEDLAGVNDAIKYLSEHKWKCGDGLNELTNVEHLKPYFYMLQTHLDNANKRRLALESSDSEHNSDDVKPVIKKHTTYLVALSIYLRLRIRGGVSGLEKRFLETYNDGSCVFEGLIARIDDGNQENALYSMRQFPADTIPTGSSWMSWGSAPPAVMQVTCAAILKGL